MTQVSGLFTGRHVLVTGGGSGIGRAVATAFVRQGATVTVAGRRVESLAETVEQLAELGGGCDAVAADVRDRAAVEALLDEVVDRHGHLDIAVNNAGIGSIGAVADCDEATWDRVIATNLTGVWLSMKYEIAQLRRSGGGCIVNVAGIVGAHMTIPGIGAYAASKAGVSALTRTAARECIGENIRINAVSPGPADTAMSCLPGETDAQRDERWRTIMPIGRIADLDEVAAAVLWLASPSSGFVVGADLVIDGGTTA